MSLEMLRTNKYAIRKGSKLKFNCQRIDLTLKAARHIVFQVKGNTMMNSVWAINQEIHKDFNKLVQELEVVVLM